MKNICSKLIACLCWIFTICLTSGQSDDDSIANGKNGLSRFNFASHQAGAVIIDKSPESAKGFHNLLNDDKDKYGICSCSEKKWVVIGLSEDILISSVTVANYEKYSSMLKDFQMLGSATYPTSEWNDLGTYTAQPMLGEQHFNVTNPTNAHTRYLKVKFLTHYLDEALCTLSQIKVHGITALAALKQEVESVAHDNLKDMLKDIDDIKAVLHENEINATADAVPVEVSVEGEVLSVPEIKPAEENTEDTATENEQTQTMNTAQEDIPATNQNAEQLQAVPDETSGSDDSQDLSAMDNDGVMQTVHFNATEWNIAKSELREANLTKDFLLGAIKRVSELFDKGTRRLIIDQFRQFINANKVNSTTESIQQEAVQDVLVENSEQDVIQDAIITNDNVEVKETPAIIVTDAKADPVNSASISQESATNTTTNMEPINENVLDKEKLIEEETKQSPNITNATAAMENESSSELQNVTTIGNNSSVLVNVPLKNVVNNVTMAHANITIANTCSGNNSNSKQAETKVQNGSALNCFDLLNFDEFQMKMMAKLQAKNPPKNDNDDTGNISKDNVFKQLVQRIRGLEMNQVILELYVEQVTDCLHQFSEEFEDGTLGLYGRNTMKPDQHSNIVKQLIKLLVDIPRNVLWKPQNETQKSAIEFLAVMEEWGRRHIFTCFCLFFLVLIISCILFIISSAMFLYIVIVLKQRSKNQL